MSAPYSSKTYRILVVDDIANIHTDFRKILQPGRPSAALQATASALFGDASLGTPLFDFELDDAFQGDQALSLVKDAIEEDRPYAVAFVDMRMPPGWDGLETTRRLWEADPALQVVLCTAFSDHSWKETTEVLGLSDNLVILKKPFDNIEVIQLAHTLTQKWILGREKQARLDNLDSLVRQRTRELEQAELCFSEAFEANPLPQAIVTLDPCELVAVNAAFVRQFGAPASANQDLAADALQLRPDLEPWKSLLPGLSPERTIDEQPLICGTLSGVQRQLLCSARPVVIRGRPSSVWVFREVTEERRAEEERKELQLQLLQAQKMESIGRLAGGVAHDFNNMLLIILGYTDITLKELPSDHPVRENLKEIRKSARRSADLTRQLLAFARKQAFSLKVTDLNDTLAGMSLMLQRLIGENINLISIPEYDLWPVKVDAAQIDQILANLVVNARDAISGPGIITLRTCNVTKPDTGAIRHPAGVVGTHVMLSVTDTGCGVDEETKSHLFEPFFTTKAIGQGTGLGLATVFGIVSQLGGMIEVDSELGKGTTFRIYLPKAEEQEIRASANHQPHKGMEESDAILLVEDEQQVLRLGAKMLGELGYRVLEASSAEEALSLADAHADRIRLLIADVVMPSMNGRKLAEKIQSQIPGLPCLFMSGYSADIINENGVIEDEAHFLQKPFSKESLAAKVEEALESAAK